MTITKTADGDTLTVTAEEKDGAVIFTLTGNGEPPEKDTENSDAAPRKTVRENGGLASLRTLVENAGGSMEIKTDEAFTVIVKMKK